MDMHLFKHAYLTFVAISKQHLSMLFVYSIIRLHQNASTHRIGAGTQHTTRRDKKN